MSNRKTTRRALLTSVMALVMCVVMLVGTTFAWFTDTASTGVNKIQAGNLDIELAYKNAYMPTEVPAADGGFAAVTENTKVFNESALWEPGHVEYVVLKISNAGTLALKYKLGINIAGETGSTNVYGDKFNLSDYIKFAVLEGDKSSETRDNLVAAATDSKLIKDGYTSTETSLYPAGTEGKVAEKIVTLVVWMPTDVGNEANHMTGKPVPSIDLGIKAVATQLTYESDSFNDKYDEKATYPVMDNAGLSDAITDATDGDTVVITSGEYDLPKSGNIASGVTIAGAGTDKTTLNVSKDEIKNDNVTLKDMTINGEAPADNDGALKIGGKNTVIENVIFNGQGFNGDTKGISVTGENLTIRNSKISGAFRGIIFWDNIGGNNLIENCTIDNVIYTFNINAQTVKPGTTLTVKNSTLNGWTSYSGCMTHVTFDGCDLGKSNGYAYLVAYADSTFTNCTFHDGYQVAAGKVDTGRTLTFNNCKLVDGTVITAENFAEKLGDVDADMKTFTVIVDGVTVNWN